VLLLFLLPLLQLIQREKREEEDFLEPRVKKEQKGPFGQDFFDVKNMMDRGNSSSIYSSGR